MKSKKVPLTAISLPAAAAIELLGASSLLLGARSRMGAGALALFLIPTSLVFHDFWNLEGQDREMQMMHFLKNLAILGGLIGVVSRGPGALSLDEGRELRRLAA